MPNRGKEVRIRANNVENVYEEAESMVDAPLLTEGEWEAAVANFDGTLHNPRIDDGHYVADFYVCADIFVDDSASKYAKCQAVAELKQSLTAALHAHDILKPVFITVEPDWGWNLIFCNLHFPMDGQAQTRLKKAAKVVWTWLREKEDRQSVRTG